MASIADPPTIDPKLLQPCESVGTQANVPLALPAGLGTIDWEGSDDLDRLVYCVLEVQDQLLGLSHDVRQQLRGQIIAIWSSIESRISNVLETRDFCRYGDTNVYLPPADAAYTLEAESDVDEQDHEFFTTLYDNIRALHWSKSRSYYVLKPLPAKQRRHAHAIAHFMSYGHLSIGTGKLRPILLSKRPSAIPVETKALYKSARSDCIKQFNCVQNLDPLERSYVDKLGSLKTFDTASLIVNLDDDNNEAAAGGYSSTGASASASASSRFSRFSRRSGWSSMSDSSSRLGKRKRAPEAFECAHPGCGEKYDRQCDLNHHARIHLPYEERPYPCEQCEKRFLFPKDLRRHEATHTLAGIEPVPSEEMGYEEDSYPTIDAVLARTSFLRMQTMPY